MTSAPPWLAIVGIGEDGRDGLSLAARQWLAQARLVVGGARHLALAGPLAAETMVWPSPLAAAIPKILARRGTPVCVLASGDPFFYGVGTTLAAHCEAGEFVALPAPSSVSLAASRLGWALQDCRLVSVHGRDLMRLVPHLQPRARILCLTWDEATPGRVATLLTERGFGASRLHILEALGGPRERVTSAVASEFALPPGDPLNMMAIDVEASSGARIVALAPGLPDDWFEHDGQITRREIRAMTLAALAPWRGAHLWDLGAGSGSVSIEWSLLDPANRATAVERDRDRAARIARNAAWFGVPEVAVVAGATLDVLDRLPPPDAVFIGGGCRADLIDRALAALPVGGRLVVNAVTLETQALLAAAFAARGGDLTSITLARADRVGTLHGWRPAMPVTQWTVCKS